MSPDDPRHGTRAGYLAHNKAGIPPCDDCRKASREYQRQWRTDKFARARERQLQAARDRATQRLIKRHRSEWRLLVADEKGRVL